MYIFSKEIEFEFFKNCEFALCFSLSLSFFVFPAWIYGAVQAIDMLLFQLFLMVNFWLCFDFFFFLRERIFWGACAVCIALSSILLSLLSPFYLFLHVCIYVCVNVIVCLCAYRYVSRCYRRHLCVHIYMPK